MSNCTCGNYKERIVFTHRQPRVEYKLGKVTKRVSPIDIGDYKRGNTMKVCKNCGCLPPHIMDKTTGLKILYRAVYHGGFNDWWPELMRELGFYNKKTDTFPSLEDIFKAIGAKDKDLEKLKK